MGRRLKINAVQAAIVYLGRARLLAPVQLFAPVFTCIVIRMLIVEVIIRVVRLADVRRRGQLALATPIFLHVRAMGATMVVAEEVVAVAMAAVREEETVAAAAMAVVVESQYASPIAAVRTAPVSGPPILTGAGEVVPEELAVIPRGRRMPPLFAAGPPSPRPATAGIRGMSAVPNPPAPRHVPVCRRIGKLRRDNRQKFLKKR